MSRVVMAFSLFFIMLETMAMSRSLVEIAQRCTP
jgi:hypothetical protein